MPTYEYKCDACGNAFEKFQSMSSPAVKKCPKCGKNKVRRLIGTGAGLIFKGSGFYITDYRDSNYANQAKAESGGGAEAKTESKSDPKPETKTEGKPETKAETKPDSKEATPPASKPEKASKSAAKPQTKRTKK